MKKTLLIIGIILTLISIPITVYFIGKNQEIRKEAAPATTVIFSPAVVSTKVGEIFTLSAEVDTGTNQVVSANIAIEFDPTKFEAQSITNGPFFPKILIAGAVSPGTASITVGAPSTTQPVTGTGVAAIIRLKAIATAPSAVSVRFSNSTFIGGIGEQQTNVLMGTTPATITINSSTNQTISTITPTPSVTGQPLIQTSITPTPTTLTASIPSPSPSPTTAASSSGTLVLTEPGDGSTVSNATNFQGKAPPGSTVTIVIHSDSAITATVITDTNGNWIYTPTTPLDPGNHTVLASTLNPSSGAVETASAEFIVSDSSSGEPMPSSGSIEYTILPLFIAAILIFFGVKSLANPRPKHVQ